MGKIAQNCLKWVISVKIYGKTSHHRYFWAIYPLQLVKKLPILMGLKKLITKMDDIH
jgi:hypothetical protein